MENSNCRILTLLIGQPKRSCLFLQRSLWSAIYRENNALESGGTQSTIWGNISRPCKCWNALRPWGWILFFRNVGRLLPVYAGTYSVRQKFSIMVNIYKITLVIFHNYHHDNHETNIMIIYMGKIRCHILLFLLYKYCKYKQKKL
jgi:hypothetical protein